ncbi:MAG: enoyl-CoA hydratase-related protein, partial [Acidobacteriota bacterium]|nr:enoyl-CoA hydratase-related protein [Acidobacteriota bacterium]
GAHFSFGASVPEHLPPTVASMLPRFHGSLLAMLDSAVPVLAAVRGQCLGGGMEVVMLCHRVFAARDARLGQPEIVLGVFAPVASMVLADRVGRGAADQLCLSGRSVTADEALAIGLVDEVLDDDPAEAALAWARTHLLPKSASSLRYAVRASRAELRARLAAELPAIERLYLDGLMSTADATEGLTAFVERRPAVWRDA